MGKVNKKKNRRKEMKKILLSIFALLLGATFAHAVGLTLNGAGATFPYPFYSKAFKEYYKLTGVKVNYQAIGSGGGIRQLLEKTVDFGASDAFVSDEGLKKFSHPTVHIPTVLGAVVLTYNLPGTPTLKFTPEIIAKIFLGKITKWNDPLIQRVNPGVKLPSIKIIVVHRSDGSGTTFIFSDYLSKVSKEWVKKVGRGKALNWPTGLGGKGNPGVAGLIKQIPGTIGYVELIYALSNYMPVALIQNKKEKFIKPSIETVSKTSNVKLPDDMRVSLTDTDAPDGYPISGFTWLLVYRELTNGGINSYQKAKALVNLLWWITHDGQKYAKPLHYAPLSDKARAKAEKIIKSITFKGKRVLK